MILTLLIIAYILLTIIVYLYQEKVVFFPQELSKSLAAFDRVSDMNIAVRDSVNLKGWEVDNREYIKKDETNLLIYFGGNKEEVSVLREEMQNCKGWIVYLINYRGYGASEGKPTEKNIFADSLDIYDYLTGKYNNISKIVVMGRSLGTGVATYLAANRKINAIVLVSPFDSLLNIAKRKYPILPLRIILKHKFDSISLANSIKIPVLVLATPDDKTIPIENTEKLANKFGGKVELIKILGESHRSINTNIAYWENIIRFLNTL